jgi:hypothetical protein
VGALATDTPTSGVPPADTPTNCVLDEDVPDEGVPSTDTLTNGVLDEDTPGTATLTSGVLLTDTPSRGVVARGEDAAGEPGGSIAWALAAPSAAHKPTNNNTTTTAVPVSLNRRVGRAGCGITHEPWRD